MVLRIYISSDTLDTDKINFLEIDFLALPDPPPSPTLYETMDMSSGVNTWDCVGLLSQRHEYMRLFFIAHH